MIIQALHFSCTELKEISGLSISTTSHATRQYDDTIMMP